MSYVRLAVPSCNTPYGASLREVSGPFRALAAARLGSLVPGRNDSVFRYRDAKQSAAGIGPQIPCLTRDCQVEVQGGRCATGNLDPVVLAG